MKSIFLSTALLAWGLAFELNVLHINDHHSHLDPLYFKMKVNEQPTEVLIGGYPSLVALIKELKEKKPNPLVLHAGDAITGTLYYTLFKGSVDAKLMNITGIDYFTLGNHEFDAGNEGLKTFLDFLKVPVLSSNVIPSEGSILKGYWKPWAIKEISGEKIGIIGLDVVKKTKESSSPGEDIKFIDEIEAASKYSKLMADMGVNKVILLSHAGALKNYEIAQKVSGIDLIITGDTHFLFGNPRLEAMGLPVRAQYPMEFTSPANEPVYVAEAWEYSKLLGSLKLVFDEKGVIKDIEGLPLIPYHQNFKRKKDGKSYELEGSEKEEINKALAQELNFVPAKIDQAAQKILEEFKAQKQQLGSKIVGQIKGKSMLGGSANRIPSDSNPKGSVATRFIAQTMLTQLRSFGKNSVVHFALQNSGGVRANIEPGQMSYNDAYDLLPFDNTLFLMQITGKELKASLEEALQFALVEGSSGAFAYCADLRYEANKTPDKNGKRLIKVEVKEQDKWREIEEQRTYNMVTNAYIARGKDGYKTFGEVSGKGLGEDTYLNDALSLVKFLELNPSFEAYEDSNVIFHYDK